MRCIIISCKTIEKELLAAMEAAGCGWEVRWVESGLHNSPNKLRRRLQELLNGCTGADTVLLAMGYCGNSLQGLVTGDFSLVVPRVDDCISLLLGSVQTRLEHASRLSAYFMTEGWLTGERNIWREYEYTVQKYGDELGREIFDAMFSHYRTLALVDTGCYDLEAARKETGRIARQLQLEDTVLPGTLSYLQQLLTGPWPDDRFLQVPPQSEVSLY